MKITELSIRKMNEQIRSRYHYVRHTHVLNMEMSKTTHIVFGYKGYPVNTSKIVAKVEPSKQYRKQDCTWRWCKSKT